MMERAPISAPSRRIAPIPTRTSSPTVQAWMAACPTVASSPDDRGRLIGHVHDRAILDIAARADFDAIDIAAQNGTVPNTRLFA
jgi:hypothetical protein